MREAKDINVLVGCEESQAVCIAFRELGFNAYSCDIQECSGGHPEWHLQMDVFEAIKENVTGKSVIIFNSLKNICWDYIDLSAMKMAFSENALFMYDDDYTNLIPVDVTKIKKP